MSFLEYALEGQREWEFHFTNDKIFLSLEENKTETTIEFKGQRRKELDEFILHVAKKLQNNGTLDIINSYKSENELTYSHYIKLLKNLTPNYNIHIVNIGRIDLEYAKNHLDISLYLVKSNYSFPAIFITIRTQLYLVELTTSGFHIYQISLYPVYHGNVNGNVFHIHSMIEYRQTFRLEWDKKLKCMRKSNAEAEFSPVELIKDVSEISVFDITKTVLLEHIIMLGLMKSENCWRQFCCVGLYDPRLFLVIGAFLFQYGSVSAW